MKNFLHISLFSLLILVFSLPTHIFAQAPAGMYTTPPAMNPQDMQAFDEELQKLLADPKAMEEMAAFAEKLMAEDPEFKKLVEDMAVEMEQEFKKQGIDLNQLPPQQPLPQIEAPTPLPPIEAPKPKPAAPSVSKKTIKEIKNILETIAEKLSDIRQKAEDDKEFKKLFEPWQLHVDDIIYYVNVLMEDHLIKYLAEKEFESLYEHLKLFAQALEQLEPIIESREFSLEGENPYSVLDIAPTSSYNQVEDAYRSKLKIHKKPQDIAQQMKNKDRTQEEIDTAQQQAKSELKTIEDAYKEIRTYEQSKENLKKLLEFDVRTIVYTLDIKSQIKKLLEKHDPEALSLAKEREKEETEARKKQDEAIKRFPPYAPPAFYFPPMTQYPGAGSQDYYPPYGGAPYVTPSTSQPIQQATTLDETKKPKGSPTQYPVREDKKSDKIDEKYKKELEAQKKSAEETKEKGLKEEAADPKVEAAVKAFQDKLDAIEDTLSKDITPGYKPTNLFNDTAKFKNALETQKPSGWRATFGLAQSIPNEILPIQKSFIEITDALSTLKKEIARTLRDATASQKSEIKKRLSAMFAEFEKDTLNTSTPILTKITIDTNNVLLVDTQKINITHEDIKCILRGAKTGASSAAQTANPGSIDFVKDYAEALKNIKSDLGVVPPVPAPPAAAAAAAAP